MTESHEPVSLDAERARRRPADAVPARSSQRSPSPRLAASRQKPLEPQKFAQLVDVLGNTPSSEPNAHEPAGSERSATSRDWAGADSRGSSAGTEPLADDEVRERAVRLLARSATSVDALRSKLIALGARPDAVESELERLVREGALDDAAMADALTSRLVMQGRSSSAIRRTLRAKGIGRSDIDATLAAHADAERDQRQADAFAAQRIERLASRRGEIDRQSVTRQLMGMLARRGFSGSVARSAIDAALKPHIGD